MGTKTPTVRTSSVHFSSSMILNLISWVTIYNANLDRSTANRKTKTELRRDLKSWEDELTKKKKIPDKAAVGDPINYQVRYSLFYNDHISMPRKITHKDEFAKLVQAARASRDRKPSPATASSPDPCLDNAASSPIGP